MRSSQAGRRRRTRASRRSSSIMSNRRRTPRSRTGPSRKVASRVARGPPGTARWRASPRKAAARAGAAECRKSG
eukprot:6193299-Pyramimonas_sp.AAC.1